MSRLSVRALALALVVAGIVVVFAGCERSRPAAVAGTGDAVGEAPASQTEAPVADEAEEIEWARAAGQLAFEVSGGIEPGGFHPSGMRLSAGPIAGAGRVYVGTTSGILLAWDDSGAFQRIVNLDGPIRAIGTLPAAIVVAAGDSIVALDPGTGASRWELRDVQVTSALATSGRGVYAGLTNGDVVAIDANDGTVRWRRRIPGLIVGSPVLFNGQVTGVTDTGTLVAIDAADGTIAWQTSLDGSFAAGPRLSPEGTERRYAVVSTEGIITVVGADGSGARQIDSGLVVVLAPVGWIPQGLVVTGADGTVAALGFDGVERWARSVGTHLAATPLAFENVVVVTDAQGGVHSLDVSSGAIVASSSIPDAVEGVPVYREGVLVVRTRRGLLGWIGVDAVALRPPLFDDSESYVLPASGSFRLRDSRVRLSLGTQSDAVFDITVAASPQEELLLELVDQSGTTVATNMGKVALSRSVRAALSASRSYELIIQRPEADGEVTIAIQTEQIQ